MFPGQIVVELGDILEFKCASRVLCEVREPEALFPSRRRHPGERCVEAADRPPVGPAQTKKLDWRQTSSTRQIAEISTWRSSLVALVEAGQR